MQPIPMPTNSWIMNPTEWIITYEENGNTLLTPKVPVITECALWEKDLSFSTLLDCSINGIKIEKELLYYRTILHIIYERAGRDCIKLNKISGVYDTMLGVTTKNGDTNIESLGLTFHGLDGRSTLKEIIKFIKILNYALDLQFELNDGTKYRFYFKKLLHLTE